MKKRPLWIKCFLLCTLGIIFTIVILMLITFYRIYVDKEYIIQSDARNISSYADYNVVGRLSAFEERFCGMNTTNMLMNAADANEAVSQITSMMIDTVGVLGVYYIDGSGNGHVIGDVGGSLEDRWRWVEEAKATEAYKQSGRAWFYQKTNRGYNSCVLFADLVYIDTGYKKNIVGQILLFVDADRVNRAYIDYEAEEDIGIVILDHVGNIVFSTKSEWCGMNFHNSFESLETNLFAYGDLRYVYNTHESEVTGWKNITYFNSNIIRRQSLIMFAMILIVAVICMIVVLVITYFLTRKVCKPIDELFKHIKVSTSGNIVLSNNLATNETDEIKSIFDELIEKIKLRINQTYLDELEFKNLKIKAYESQINPHFIFNTLQIIQMLNVLGKTGEANKVITSFGEMVRFNLDNATTVKLSEEIQMVKNYLRILKYRYQQKFDYKIDIDEALYNCEVLKFVIQPFVENSIKHGFDEKTDLCEIVIMARRVNDELVFIIRDNGCGIEKEKLAEIKRQLSGEAKIQSGNGIGIFNVNNRLKLVYGEQYGVEIYCNKYTHVAVHMPYRETNEKEGDSIV